MTRHQRSARVGDLATGIGWDCRALPRLYGVVTVADTRICVVNLENNSEWKTRRAEMQPLVPTFGGIVSLWKR